MKGWAKLDRIKISKLHKLDKRRRTKGKHFLFQFIARIIIKGSSVLRIALLLLVIRSLLVSFTALKPLTVTWTTSSHCL